MTHETHIAAKVAAAVVALTAASIAVPVSIGALIGSYDVSPAAPAAPAVQVTPRDAAQSVIDSYELKMRWSCEDSIKDQLSDPRSYETRKLTFMPSERGNDTGAVVSVIVAFGARNGFGGMTTSVAACGFNAAGELTSSAAIIQ